MTLRTRPALDWNAEALQRRLDATLPGIAVEVAAQIDSTSSELLRRAQSVAGRRRTDHDATLLVAEDQTQGRGRQGRPWVAEPGASLTFSLALPLAPADWSGLSLAVGVALADALEPPAPGAPARPSIGLKWPNDLWLWDGPGCGRKLGGILVETVAVGAARMAVIGVGLNLRPIGTTVRSGGPALSQGYGCLSEIDPGADAPAVLARVAPPLVSALLAFATQGLAPARDAFARRDVLAGQPVQTLDVEGRPGDAGVADGIDTQGALQLRGPRGTRRVVSGEVSVRLPAAPAGGRPSDDDRSQRNGRPC